MTRTIIALLLLAALGSASYLARLEVGPVEREEVLAEALPVYKDLGTSLILPLSEDQLVSLRASGWQVEVLDTDLAPGDYLSRPRRRLSPRPGAVGRRPPAARPLA